MLSEDLEGYEPDFDYYDYDYDDYDKSEEKYYWETQNGDFIPVDKLEDEHIKNIVFKFGKDELYSKGHARIVDKFYEIKKNQNF